MRGLKAASIEMMKCANLQDFEGSHGIVLQAPNDNTRESTISSGAYDTIAARVAAGWKDITEERRAAEAKLWANEAKDFIAKYEKAIQNQMSKGKAEAK